MRILVAVEDWGPAHVGAGGVAWWLAHGLAARGHKVEVVAARSRGGERGSVSVRTVPATWPPAPVLALASERARHGSRARPGIQREILANLGAVSDTSGIVLRDVDAVLALGLLSPHVRQLTERARGHAVVLRQLQEGDRAVSALPVVQYTLRRQQLVTHCARTSSALAPDLGPIEVIAPGMNPPAPPWEAVPPWTSPRATEPNPGPVLLVDATTPVDARWEMITRLVGRSVRRVRAPQLAAARIDDLLLSAGAVVVGAGDAGDVPNLAMRYRVPLVVDPDSSGASDVTASGGGWVAGVESPIRAVLEAALGRDGVQRGLAGEAFVLWQRSWDALCPAYERAIEAAGTLNRGVPGPSATAP